MIRESKYPVRASFALECMDRNSEHETVRLTSVHEADYVEFHNQIKNLVRDAHREIIIERLKVSSFGRNSLNRSNKMRRSQGTFTMKEIAHEETTKDLKKSNRASK